MKALFTGALGDFLGAESFMTEDEKDAVTEVLWATRNREEIRAAVDLKSIFPNLQTEIVMFDDFCDDRPTKPWTPGDRFINIHSKHDLNRMCGLNLTLQQLEEIQDFSLDAVLAGIFSNTRSWTSSRIATRSQLVSVDKFNLPEMYVAIHPWSDAEANGREFNDSDWNNIFKFLETYGIKGVVLNLSKTTAPVNSNLIDLTNQTTVKEAFAIIQGAEACIMCASSLACYATKIFPKDRIWLKGGVPHMFSEWATYFYHGPFKNPSEIIFKDLTVLDFYSNNQ
jgi:hypothetical protein